MHAVQFAFEKESKKTIRAEAYLQEDVANLKELVMMEGPKMSIKYTGLFTTIDGKVLNEMTHKQSCTQQCKCMPSSRHQLGERV